MGEGEEIGGLPGEELGGLPGEELGGLPGEELGGDPMVDESIAPDELDSCSKPAIDPMGGEVAPAPAMGGEMKPAMDPAIDSGMGAGPASQNLQDQPIGGDMKPSVDPQGGEMKPVTPSQGVDFEQNIQNKGGIPGQHKKQVILNGQPLGAMAEVMEASIGKVGRNTMDLSGVINVLNKSASEKEISQEKAQDSSDIGQYSAGEGGSLMGHESETIKTPQKPSVPRDNALMGQEDSNLNPQDKPQPVIPSGDATMGHEKEVGLDAGDNRYTGGDKGQGKTDLASGKENILTAGEAELYHMRGFGNTRDGVSSLADRIAKKLAPKEPVAKDKDIQPISDGGTIGKEEKFTADDPTNVEGSATESLMGHESETLKAAPKEPADQPEVFTGNAQQGKEELDSEKTNKDKGTVIASSDSESEAMRVAALMLQSKKIEASELVTKVNELRQYQPAQIRDFEKAIFASEKGLNTVEDGKLSKPVQINETSSVRNSKDELSTKISSLFSLAGQNREADASELAQLRKTYGK